MNNNEKKKKKNDKIHNYKRRFHRVRACVCVYFFTRVRSVGTCVGRAHILRYLKKETRRSASPSRVCR